MQMQSTCMYVQVCVSIVGIVRFSVSVCIVCIGMYSMYCRYCRISRHCRYLLVFPEPGYINTDTYLQKPTNNDYTEHSDRYWLSASCRYFFQYLQIFHLLFSIPTDTYRQDHWSNSEILHLYIWNIVHIILRFVFHNYGIYEYNFEIFQI